MKKLLYRASKRLPGTVPGEFWADDPSYSRMIHPTWPLYRGRISLNAKVQNEPGSPSKNRLAQLRRAGVDVVVFDAWDWNCKEYVVLNVRVLEGMEQVQ